MGMKFDLLDRRCVVTGATSGIGKEIARNLAYFGATVVIVCRDRDKGSATLQELVEDSGNDRISLMQAELSSQSSLRSLVRLVTAGDAPVHVLVNNAGIFASDKSLSPEGHELTWATNTLAYFSLANLLMPTLRRNAPARVVNVASAFAGELDVDDLNFERRKYKGISAYKQSKQANRMLTWGLANKLGGSAEVSVHACHPGGVATSIYDNVKGVLGPLARIGKRFMQTPQQGATTPTLLAADPELHAQTNQFWCDEKPQLCKYRDPGQIDTLWERCVEMSRTDLA